MRIVSSQAMCFLLLRLGKLKNLTTLTLLNTAVYRPIEDFEIYLDNYFRLERLVVQAKIGLYSQYPST
jgi:hypothetical protein